MDVFTGCRWAKAIGGKGMLLALALAGVIMQGCTTEDAPEGPVTGDSPPAELSAAAQTASGAKTLAKSVGGGCTLHMILADDGSRARGNAWLSCDRPHSQLGIFAAYLNDESNGKQKFAQGRSCRDVYWCGLGNIYIDDPSGTQNYSFTVIGVVEDHFLDKTTVGNRF